MTFLNENPAFVVFLLFSAFLLVAIFLVLSRVQSGGSSSFGFGAYSDVLDRRSRARRKPQQPAE